MPPLVLHVLYRFDTGGLENGVVNILNGMAPGRYRHAVLAIDEVVPAFAARVKRSDVGFHALHKPPGHALRLYPKMWRLMRELRPAIVHSRNLAALEAQVPAMLAGVPARIHGEHGRDVEDLDGNNRRLQRLRRAYSLFVHRYVTVSQDLKSYVVDRVGIAPERVTQIYNGVNTELFHPPAQGRDVIDGCPFQPSRHWLVGTVGRMKHVKNQTLLADAFCRAAASHAGFRERARLVIVGEGPLRRVVLDQLQQAGMADHAWLPGERSDVPQVLRGLDVFVLPSLAEGVSNTILESMACGVPVLATAVGGNVELVEPGVTGELLPPQDPQAMAAALLRQFEDAARADAMRGAGRRVAESRYSLAAMVESYASMYDAVLGRHGTRPR